MYIYISVIVLEIFNCAFVSLVSIFNIGNNNSKLHTCKGK